MTDVQEFVLAADLCTDIPIGISATNLSAEVVEVPVTLLDAAQPRSIQASSEYILLRHSTRAPIPSKHLVDYDCKGIPHLHTSKSHTSPHQ